MSHHIVITELFQHTDHTFNPLKDLGDEPVVTFREAVRASGVTGIDMYVTEAISFAERNPDNVLNQDEVASINFYTLETIFYKEMNAALNKSAADVKKFFPYLRLVLSALFKCPLVCGTFTRGIKNPNQAIREQLLGIGGIFYWWGFTSTTENVERTKIFLGDNEDRILFMIKGAGVDIQRFSELDEREVLILPGAFMKLEGILQQGKLMVAQLTQQAPPEFLIYSHPQSELLDATNRHTGKWKRAWATPTGILAGTVMGAVAAVGGVAFAGAAGAATAAGATASTLAAAAGTTAAASSSATAAAAAAAAAAATTAATSGAATATAAAASGPIAMGAMVVYQTLLLWQSAASAGVAATAAVANAATLSAAATAAQATAAAAAANAMTLTAAATAAQATAAAAAASSATAAVAATAATTAAATTGGAAATTALVGTAGGIQIIPNWWSCCGCQDPTQLNCCDCGFAHHRRYKECKPKTPTLISVDAKNACTIGESDRLYFTGDRPVDPHVDIGKFDFIDKVWCIFDALSDADKQRYRTYQALHDENGNEKWQPMIEQKGGKLYYEGKYQISELLAFAF